MGKKYFGSFTDRDSVLENFCRGEYDYEKGGYKTIEEPEGFPTDDEILFASYGGRSYEGDALVVYERDGKLYQVSGGHCSCNGLEDQWAPEETTREALRMEANAKGNPQWRQQPNCYRLRDNEHEDEAADRFYELFGDEGE